MTEWIAITDKWPREGMNVIVKTTGNSELPAYRYGWMWYFDGQLCSLHKRDGIEKLITHWRENES